MAVLDKKKETQKQRSVVRTEDIGDIGDLNSQEGDIVINTIAQII